MSSWYPRNFLSKRLQGEKQSVITAFYTDVPTDITTAEDCVSNAQFIAAYSKDKWSSGPRRILIHSKDVMDELRGISNVPDSQKTGVLAMVPPFKHLIHYRSAIKSKLDELKKAASDREHSPSVGNNDPTGEDRRIHRLQCIHDFIQTDLANYIGLELRVQNGDISEVLFEEIYHLFKPGDLVVAAGTTDEQLYQVTSVTGGRTILSSRYEGSGQTRQPGGTQTRDGTWTEIQVDCFVMAWEGENIGPRPCCPVIPYFAGTRLVTDLEVFPIQFHKDGSALRKRSCARGLKYVQCSGHKIYTGASLPAHFLLTAFNENPTARETTGSAGAGDNSAEDKDGKFSRFEMARGDVYIDFKSFFPSGFSTTPMLGYIRGPISEPAEAIDTLSDSSTWDCSDHDINGFITARFLSTHLHLIKFGKPKENLTDDVERLQLLPVQIPAFVFSRRKWGKSSFSRCFQRLNQTLILSKNGWTSITSKTSINQKRRGIVASKSSSSLPNSANFFSRSLAIISQMCVLGSGKRSPGMNLPIR